MFYGKNGCGKTNILEGISLFSKGRGLRKDKLSNIIKKNCEKFILKSDFKNEDIVYNLISETENFNNYLKTIIKQINQIENLVNEFSDFARMPKPIFNKNKIVEIVKNNISLLREVDQSISIKFNYYKEDLLIKCDSEQISRVFFNLIKNSIESIQEKSKKNGDFTKIIDIEIIDKNDYITLNITDNGTGFSKDNIKDITKPYFTTKPQGSGLGLSIVNKIVNDHNGSINFSTNNNGAKVEIILSKN